MNIQRGPLLSGLLIGSVILNLLLLGAMLGRFLSAPPPLRSFPPSMGWVMRGLPPEERQEIRPLLAGHMKGAISAQQALAAAQRKATTLLRADELDEPALQQAFAELREASLVSQERMHGALVKVMVALTPEQREKVLGYMRGGWRGDAGRGAGERRGPRAGRARERMPPPPSPEDEPDGPPPDGM